MSDTAPKHLTTDPRKTLFVARLNLSTTEESLQKLFGRFGELDQVILIRNQVTGTSQGYGFVTFRRSAAASEAYKRAHHAVLDEHVILVDYERSRIMKGWVPRRLGGGFGGQKESGQLRFGARERGFREPINLRRSDRREPITILPDQRYDDNWRDSDGYSTSKSASRYASSSHRHRSSAPDRHHHTERSHKRQRSRSPDDSYKRRSAHRSRSSHSNRHRSRDSHRR